MKIFLVDDEPLTAKWIESVLLKTPGKHTIGGRAGDGREALEQISFLSIDLVITDIRMPGMDGLELIRRLKELSPGIHILIISSHSDFRYTSEALRLGADDYLLKSEMSEEDLYEALTRIEAMQSRQTIRLTEEEASVQRCDVEKQNRRQAAALNLLLGKTVSGAPPISIAEAHALLCLDRSSVYCLLIRIVKNDGLIDIRDILTLIQGNGDLLGEKTAVTAESSDLICLTGEATSRNTVHPEKKILSGITSIRGQLEGRFQLILRYGLSTIHSEAGDVPGLYDEAKRALDLQEFYRGRDNFPSSGISLTELQNNRQDLEKLLDDVRREMILENYKYAFRLAEKILEIPGQDKPVRAVDARNIMTSLIMALETGTPSAEKAGMIGRCESFRELDTVCRGYLEDIEKECNGANARRNSTIERACSYIQNHYGDSQMSLITVSDHVGLNSTYLSDLFRKKMGVTFQDYLSGIRLEKAEYLLEHSTISITQITEQVGFQSGSYFSRFFRKRHGISPSEYRDRNN